jgi:chemotaxis protein methyltransferase CheR
MGYEVVATDTDPHLLERARRGCYPESSLREVPDAWRAVAFEDRGGLFRLQPELRADVRFRQDDLRNRFPEGPFHLVLWRNLVFTYFEPELQRELLARLPEVLWPGGFLVVGAHEELPEASPGFARWRWNPRIYVRGEAAAQSS